MGQPRSILRADPAQNGPQGFRWRLAGVPLPPLGAALPLGQAVRAAIYDAAAKRGIVRLPDEFHRDDDDPRHTHAFWLPEDADADGLLDHVLLFAELGLPPPLLPVLAEAGEVWLGRLGRWALSPDWMGRRAPGAQFGPARHWQAATVYVTPRWQMRKPSAGVRDGRAPEEQVWKDIVSRGLPEPVSIGWSAGISCRSGLIGPRSFVVAVGKRKPPADRSLGFPVVTFPEPIWGPLAIGFGAHFGLGRLAPANSGRVSPREVSGDDVAPPA